MASLASLYSIIMGPYNALASRGRSAANRSQQVYAQKYRNDLIRIIQKYELDGDRIAAIAERDRLDRGAQFAHWRMQLSQTALQETGKALRSKIDVGAEELKGRRGSFSKFVTDWTNPYQQVIGAVAKERAKAAAERQAAPMQFQRAMGAMAGTDQRNAPHFDLGSPRFPSTFREAVKEAQSGGLGTFVVFETDGATLEQARWVGSDDLNATTLGRSLERLIGQYNERNREYQAQKNEFEVGINQIAVDLKQLQGKMDLLTDAELEAASSQLRDRELALYDKRSDDVGAPDDPDALQAEKRRLESDVINHPGYLEAVKQLRGTLPEDERRRRNLAIIISDPPFRAWAEDHGYDLGRIGNAEVTWEGGVPTVVKKRLGIDAVKAYRVWAKQNKLAPGDYGRLAGPGTGEVVMVALKDGTQVWGERLKFHAADPMGTMRISTEAGELKTFTADMLSDVVSFTRDADPSRAQEAAQKMARYGTNIQEMREQVTEEVQKELEYHTAPSGVHPYQDKYYKWKEGPNEGEYVTKKEWDDLLKAATPQVQGFIWKEPKGPRSGSINGFVSKGGDVWVTTPKNNGYIKLTPEQVSIFMAKMDEHAETPDNVIKTPIGVIVEGVKRWATPENISWGNRSELDYVTEPERAAYDAAIANTTEVANLTPVMEAPEPVTETRLKIPEGLEGLQKPLTLGDAQVPRKTYVVPPVGVPEPEPEPEPEGMSEGGVVGADGPEVVRVGEEGPEFVIPNTLMTPEIMESIRSLAASRGIEIDTSVATEAEAPPEEEEEDEVDLLEEGVTQKANSNYKLGLAMLDELESRTSVKPPPSILEIKRIVGLTRSLTLNVSYMEETLNRAENSEKMSPEWQKHMADFNAYSDRSTQLQEELKKLTEKIDMSQLMAQAKKARTQAAGQRDGRTV